MTILPTTRPGTARTSAGRFFLRILLTLAAAFTLNALLGGWVRYYEALSCAKMLGLTPLGSRTHALQPNLIQAFPPEHAGFTVAITPSCSSLASILAVIALGSLMPTTNRRRLAAAVTVAAVAIAVGNLVRISSSVAVGYLSSTAGLVLFHDWVGSIFSFVYTLLGFLLLLRILLPADAVRTTAGVTP